MKASMTACAWLPPEFWKTIASFNGSAPIKRATEDRDDYQNRLNSLQEEKPDFSSFSQSHAFERGGP
jgi:hypothetical protein